MQLLSKTATFPVGPGRTFSVWSWDRMEYDYFLDPNGNPDVAGWNFRPGRATTSPISKVGDPIENLLRELPSGARYLGHGPDAKGEIVVKSRREALWGKTNVPGRASGTGSVDGLGGDPEQAASMLPLILAGGIGFMLLGGFAKLKQALR